MNPLFQIEGNVSAFQRLSGSLLSFFVLPTVKHKLCSGYSDFAFQCTTVRQNTEVTHFIWCIWLTYRRLRAVLMYSVGALVPVWNHYRCSLWRGHPIMVLGCTTSESWTRGPWLRSCIWLENLLESSRVAVGYEGLGPRYNLSCSFIRSSFLYTCTRCLSSLSIWTAQWDSVIVNFPPFCASCFASQGRNHCNFFFTCSQQ